MRRHLLALALLPCVGARLGEPTYSYSYTEAPTMTPTASMAPTRAETYAPTRTTEAPSYAPTTDTYAPTGSPTATAAPTVNAPTPGAANFIFNFNTPTAAPTGASADETSSTTSTAAPPVECEPGEIIQDGVCVPDCSVPTGSTYNSTTGQCECELDMVEEDDECKPCDSDEVVQDGVCVPDCSVPTGSTYNATTGQCECELDMVEEDDECKPCDSDEVVQDGVCVPDCSVPTGSTYNSTTGQCECELDMVEEDDECKSCEPGEVVQDGVCVPDCSVPTGSTYNSTTGQCECELDMVEEDDECKPCDSDEVVQDGVCVPDCSVPTGSTYNATTGQCECELDMVEEDDECKSCEPGEVVQDGSCVQSTSTTSTTTTKLPTPTEQPTAEPTAEPTTKPAAEPTGEPTASPTGEPTAVPTGEPTAEPTRQPTLEPTAEPTGEPTAEPTRQPTSEPTASPTGEPTAPTAEPTGEPTAEPTRQPTSEPTVTYCSGTEYLPDDTSCADSPLPCTGYFTVGGASYPCEQGTGESDGTCVASSNTCTIPPTAEPTAAPSSSEPTAEPIQEPTAEPTAAPSRSPTHGPTPAPTPRPAPRPTRAPTLGPTPGPMPAPTPRPAPQPTRAPTLGPTPGPMPAPTPRPAPQPTQAPTLGPTPGPTPRPTAASTPGPTTPAEVGPTCANGQDTSAPAQTCSWPAGTHNYGIITKEDARIPDKQIYKPILVGGDLTDTHSGNGQIASKCNNGAQNGQTYPPCSGSNAVPSRIGGVNNGANGFKSGVFTNQDPLYPTYLDWSALEELARTITAGTYGSGQNGHYVVVLTDTSTVRGTQDLPSVNGWNEIRFSHYCTYNGCQDYQWGNFLIVIRSDRKIKLVFGGNPAKMGAMILAPFSEVQVASNIEFVDGLIVAKKLEMEGTGNQVQFHSSIYDGTLECKPCIDATPTAEPTVSSTLYSPTLEYKTCPAVNDYNYVAECEAEADCPGSYVIEQDSDTDGWSCEVIRGSLTIQSTPSTRVTAAGLANMHPLRKVCGTVIIQKVDATSLHGLHNLTFVGGSLTIQENSYYGTDSDAHEFLTTLEGLGVKYVGGALTVQQNYYLEDLGRDFGPLVVQGAETMYHYPNCPDACPDSGVYTLVFEHCANKCIQGSVYAATAFTKTALNKNNPECDENEYASVTLAPVQAPVECTGCWPGTSGVCMSTVSTQCYDLNSNGDCPTGSSPC